MCRHEFAYYACGHAEDIGFFCDEAQSYGPLFNKLHCFYYIKGPGQHFASQCGKQGHGFYCAKTQDGVLIDGTKNALDTSNAQCSLQAAQFERIVLAGNNYHSEARARNIPIEHLDTVPAYRNLKQQRNRVGAGLTITRNRITYLNSLLNHAFRNRAALAPGFGPQPTWDRIKFDFENTIFPEQLLHPIREKLPGYIPNHTPRHANVPMILPATHPVENTQNQHQDPFQAPTDDKNNDAGLDVQIPQESRTAQRPKLRVTTTPIKQKSVTTESTPINPGIIRGLTPEGETTQEKAIRYRDQLTDYHHKKVAAEMTKAGYDVENHGVRPVPKNGHRRPAQPKPTPTKKNPSPSSKAKTSGPAPANVRRSKRTRNSKPKYAEGSDNSSGFGEVSPSKTDAAWNDSPDRSDAVWMDETPSKPEVSSSPSRPIRGTGGRNKRFAQHSTGSPNSSPTQGQVLLGSKILDYQKGIENSPSPGSMQMGAAPPFFDKRFPMQSGASQAAVQEPRSGSLPGPHTNNLFNQSEQMSHVPSPTNMYTQQHHDPSGGPSTGPYPQRMSHSAYTPQQKTASMQRSAQLLQQLDRDLYQQQLASGVVGTGGANISNSPSSQQHDMSPTMYAPQPMRPQASRAISHAVPQQSSSQRQVDFPASFPNFFHHNLQQAMAAKDAQVTPVLGQRSFSTGSVPTSMIASPQLQGIQTSPLSSGFQPAPTTHADYENMRRSFSSTTNLTPQSSFNVQHDTPNAEPLKRSLPPMRPTVSRKRTRLSLPGEDEAPTLTPSSSSFQFHAPAGLPVDDHVDYAANIAAIEEFEKQNNAGLATFDSAPTHVDPGTHQGVPIDPQLYDNANPTYGFNDYSADSHPIYVEGQIAEPTSAGESSVAEGFNNLVAEASSSELSEPDWSLLNEDMF